MKNELNEGSMKAIFLTTRIKIDMKLTLSVGMFLLDPIVEIDLQKNPLC